MEGTTKRAQVGQPHVDLSQPGPEDRLHLSTTGHGSRAREAQQRADLAQRQPQRLCLFDEPDLLQRITTVQSEASPATSGLGDHAQAFVVAEGISAQFSLGGELSDSIDLCGPALSVSHAPSMHLGVDFRVNPALLSETAASV